MFTSAAVYAEPRRRIRATVIVSDGALPTWPTRSPGSPLSAVPEFGHSFLSFPVFFGLTAQVIPLRSGLRVFCFHGSSPESMGPSHKADASLRLHAPSPSLVPQRKRGRKKGKTKCPIYMLSGIGF